MATYLERYQNGEQEQVWTELRALGAQVRQEPLLTDAYAVACETMRRVKANIEMLAPRLPTLGYQFGIWDDAEPVEGYSGPQIAPAAATPKGVARVERKLGMIPLSVRAFAEIVGSVDFRGHHPEWAEKYGMLDPLVVEVPFADREWIAYILETAEEAAEEGEEPLAIEIAPDIYHKDNISGGPPYAIATNDPAIDGPIQNMHYAPIRYMGSDDVVMFVDYLRVCLRWGGFPVFADKQEQERPQEQIEFLTQGLSAF